MRRTFLTFFLLLLVWTAATAGSDAKRAATDKFAKCLNQKGATMYGVFWCAHCKDQKDLFGDSFQYVKYVECVTKDAPRDLIPECKAQGIKHTPTWIFANGDRQEGVVQFTDLAAKTGCTAP
jgi:hypothetical protein